MLLELERNGVFSRDRKGVIYSRRIVRDEKKSSLARKNGKNGGNPSLSKQKEIPASDKGEVKDRLNTHKPEAISHIPEAASAAGALVDFKKSIMDAFRQAGSQKFPNTHRAEIWISQGCKPEICIAVIRECLARNPSISSLTYFDGAIREAHEKAPAMQTAAPGPKEISDADWRLWMQRYKSGDGPWPASLGPRPRMGGCLVPAHVLAEFLPAIIALEKERAPLAGVS
ncbi:MAG: hypothetical protein WDN46_14195 [Methylocella sp.]